MKCKPLILAAILGLSLSTSYAADIKMVDGIAAVVDNDVITYSELNQAIAMAKQHLPKDNQINDSELRQQVLTQLINQSMLIQAGKRRNLTVTNAEVDELIAHNAQERHITVDDIYTQAAKEGVSKASLRRNIANSIMTKKVQQEAVMQSAQVSDQEVESFIAYAKEHHIALPEGEPVHQYHAQHILIKSSKDNTSSAEAEIRKIYQQARSGVDFSSLARQYSQDGSATNGGDLGWFTDGVMVPQFENALHQLQPGQISPPVRTQFGWHIIKLVDERDAGTPEERLKNTVRQYITQQKIEQATQNLLKQLQAASYVQIRQ